MACYPPVSYWALEVMHCAECAMEMLSLGRRRRGVNRVKAPAHVDAKHLWQ